jgi:hypothetical protein
MPDFAFKAILPLYWCILIALCWRRASLMRVLLACLAMPAAATVMLAAVNFATPRLTTVFDPVAMALDGSLGFQPVPLVAWLFASCSPLKEICLAAYMFLTATVAVSAGLEIRTGQMQGIGVLPTFLFAGILAYALYFVMPVVGPGPFLGGDFATLLSATRPACQPHGLQPDPAQLRAIDAYIMGRAGLPGDAATAIAGALRVVFCS